MPKTLYNSSTPIKPNFDPVSKKSSTTIDCTMNYEKIYPGIYLTPIKDLCSPDDLKIYGFTHIIYIDKHIMQNNASSNESHSINNVGKNDHDNVINKTTGTSVTASITIRQTIQNSNLVSCVPGGSHSLMDRSVSCSSKSTASTSNFSSSSASSLSSSSSSSMSYNHEMPIDDETTSIARNENLFGHSDFDTLDLNFGESTYFTANVLPNCYKAVAFIEKALKNNGAVLVIDCIGENQKCITIVIGFLMYKYNKNFL